MMTYKAPRASSVYLVLGCLIVLCLIGMGICAYLLWVS